METIPKNMVDKVINQIDEIHKKISKIETNQNETVWLDGKNGEIDHPFPV